MVVTRCESQRVTYNLAAARGSEKPADPEQRIRHLKNLNKNAEDMKMYVRKFSKSIFQYIALCIVLSFSSSFASGEEIKDGLSIENVYMFYFAKKERLKVMFALINTGNTDITILTENLNTGFLDKFDNPKCEIGAGIKIKYKDYSIIQSLYRFDPITLRAKEGANINHLVKRKPEDIEGITDLIVRYKIEEDFGKRHNVWYGAVESTPTKLKIIK